jgi:hypothetical protein
MSLDSLLNEAQERLLRLESSLPAELDAMAVSRRAKLPFKALLYRETLIWRMAGLSRVAIQSFKGHELASAMLLTRAAVETSAALWYATAKLDATLESGTVADLDTYLMRLAMGSKADRDILPEPVNVLTFVDRVDKDVEGFRQQYDRLSEFAHPNWAGTTLLYSKSDAADCRTEFGSNIRGADSTKMIGLANLNVALMAFDRSYNRISELMRARWIEHRSGSTIATAAWPRSGTSAENSP